ncbi:ABC(binding protein) family transporter: phosphate, partial [Ostreococcus lucimarinus CCE9901]
MAWRVVAVITCATSWTWATVSANAVTLIGAGASFPASVYGEAMSAYAQATANVTVTYNSFGSGSGLCRIQNASVDFACSDALLNDTAYAAYPDLQMYPVIAGAVALVYNLPDSTYSGTATVLKFLKFDANALLGVFLGNITRWNDAAITALNPTMTLPNELIKIVVRQDSSGTTEAWTSALSTMNASFASGVGTSKLPDWSAVLSSYVTRSQGIGVTSYVKATNYSLGY